MNAPRFKSLGFTGMGRVTHVLWCAEVMDTGMLYPIRRKPLNLISLRSLRSKLHSRFRVSAERSDFQDLQGYVKPSHLMQATEVEIYSKSSTEKLLSSLKGDESYSLFKVDITTSKLYGSDLSDLNAGVLLCLIDEMGNSILQRIPTSLMIYHSTKNDILGNPEILSFQRGSLDEFVFKGPKLGRLEAIWLGIESGQWRVETLSLTVISWFQPSIEQSNGEEFQYVGHKFDFPANDILLGEGSEYSMVELRPCLVTQLSGVEALSILNGCSSHSNLTTLSKSNEESMQEYTDLKFSLLLYDAMLIFTGTSVASLSAGENAGFAFFVGGVIGFLYLLLLQKSVDELPASISISGSTGIKDRPFERYKGPLSTLALAVGFAIFAAKYNLGDSVEMVTPKEILIGMLGFLACKVAVVLAAVRPMTLNREVDE